MSAPLAKKHCRVSYNTINNSALSEKSKINGQDKYNGSSYFLRKYVANGLIKATSLPNHDSNQIRRRSSRLLQFRQRQKHLNSGRTFGRSFQKETLNNRRAALRNKEKLVTSLTMPTPEGETSSIVSSDSVIYMGTLYNRHPGFGEIEVVDLTKSSSNVTVVENGIQNATELKQDDTQLSLDKQNCSVNSFNQSNTQVSSHTESHDIDNPTRKRLTRRRCRSEAALRIKHNRNFRTIDIISISSDSTD
ncbi:hypothetical protein ILUMI_19378 [Ignelater luminosus]|uniref:Uncharacterized protein n=1 Tax=Ignelater luminosus TaxID=2038154 RepID=A0A8K0CN76_IGNLU|nr:hypothetical protein ILUMI_19378 [Ignelater luminosus]